MSKLFDLESPLMSGLNKLADLIILNLLTIVCCIPVFTIGASITALHYVCLKMVRDEETYVVKGFFKSFKQNFKQATIIWLIELVIFGVLVMDFYLMGHAQIEFPAWLPAALLAVDALIFLLGIHIFPLLARFENSVSRTIRNSVMVGILTLPKTILMVVICIVPVVLVYFFEQIIAPLLLLLGISGPAFICALLYNKTFKKFEPQQEDKDPDEWFIEPEEAEEAKPADTVEETECNKESESLEGSGE